MKCPDCNIDLMETTGYTGDHIKYEASQIVRTPIVNGDACPECGYCPQLGPWQGGLDKMPEWDLVGDDSKYTRIATLLRNTEITNVWERFIRQVRLDYLEEADETGASLACEIGRDCDTCPTGCPDLARADCS